MILLSVLNERIKDKMERERLALQKVGERNAMVVKLLSTRARNVESRHVIIRSNNDRGHMKSGEFRAANSHWIAYVETITNPNETKLGVRYLSLSNGKTI